LALIAALVLGLGSLLLPSFSFAEEGNASASALTAVISNPTVNGVSDTAFYMIVGVIGFEVLVILGMLYQVKLLLSIERQRKLALQNAVQPVGPRIVRFSPGWYYGLFALILFTGLYSWRYQAKHIAPLSGDANALALQKDGPEKTEDLNKAAGTVDENTVKLLTGPEDQAAGKAIFETTCFACHGKNGEGIVGPNLTDEYWLHGGSIQDIFKTIKYGWPLKGMKSWKDDYSPLQISQIASYVKSLAGTNPANAKAHEGNLEK
jgi:cytochrome c oxidase cbb3-type subunit 3